VDKVLGSEIMVLFNTQLNPHPAHAAAAVAMALDLRAALTELHERLSAGPGAPHYAIALHSGVATLGNVGGPRRRSFTALGDTINLTRRIHDALSPGEIILTEATAERLPSAIARSLRFEARPPLQVRGRQQPTSLFEVRDD
jgi:adenylate cyclase